MTNPEGLPYRAGTILTDTQAHLTKLTQAWSHIVRRRESGQPLYNVSGLQRGLPLPHDTDPWLLDDEWSGAWYSPRLRELGLAHLGGDPRHHDVLVTNRLTAALFAAMQVTVVSGSTVIGVSASYSHPAVVRAVRDAGGHFVDTVGADEFAAALTTRPDVSVVVLTRLAVSYDALPIDQIRLVVNLAHERGAVVVVDDAGGARVGPAMLDQPATLELGADLGATGLDKYGVTGPRVGLLAGRTDLVAKARARAFELGSECRPVLYPAVVNCLADYRPQQVVDLVKSTRQVGAALRERLGDWVEQTPFITRLPGEAILAELARRASSEPVIAPIEATAAVAMCLLRDHGMLTVHFAGLPPGTAALLIKFLPAGTVTELGGVAAFTAALDDSLTCAAQLASDPAAVRTLLHGPAAS
jgi:L-seryl-tRNA(Ser) seleniumtransferase